jgi:hypothetical protein
VKAFNGTTDYISDLDLFYASCTSECRTLRYLGSNLWNIVMIDVFGAENGTRDFLNMKQSTATFGTLPKQAYRGRGGKNAFLT